MEAAERAVGGAAAAAAIPARAGAELLPRLDDAPPALAAAVTARTAAVPVPAATAEAGVFNGPEVGGDLAGIGDDGATRPAEVGAGPPSLPPEVGAAEKADDEADDETGAPPALTFPPNCSAARPPGVPDDTGARPEAAADDASAAAREEETDRPIVRPVVARPPPDPDGPAPPAPDDAPPPPPAPPVPRTGTSAPEVLRRWAGGRPPVSCPLPTRRRMPSCMISALILGERKKRWGEGK